MPVSTEYNENTAGADASVEALKLYHMKYNTGMKISILSQAEKCQVIFNVDLPSANDDLTLTG